MQARADHPSLASWPVVFVLWVLGAGWLHAGESYYPLRPDDAQAVYATPETCGVRGDGVADDTAALQRALDRAQETTKRGIVFLPSGRYRLTAELRIWSGLRLIGYGPQRPVLVLAPHTPGYQEGAEQYLVHFVSDRPLAPDHPLRDANPGTFYSALSNVDLEIGDGNPAAVGVRAHYAQHCYLAHIDFFIGQGRAGVEEIGNEAEDLHFHGGEFGLTMHKPSPSWPFLLIDSTFEGQRRAAIETEEGGLTLIRVQAKNTPTVVLVRPERSEELWVEDSRFEQIAGPAIVISEEQSARTQINLRNVVCVDAPVFARFRESGREIAGAGALYCMRDFSHGLQIADLGATPELKTVVDAEPLTVAPAPVPSDLAPLPPMTEWVNVRALGAKGDGLTDDTAALRAAVAQHRALYLPSGRYRLTDTLTLRPDTVLIGLNPITTQLVLADDTAAFQGENGPAGPPPELTMPGIPRSLLQLPPFPGTGGPKPLVESAAGGAAILTGLGLDTGGINNRAVALKWRAGAHSLVNDVRFLGGHGTYDSAGNWLEIYNNNNTADSDARRRWDAQFPSLWVTEGGGGVFKDIWTPSPFASAGLCVSDTATPGRVYALSSEHHVRHEIQLHRVAHWKLYAIQTEAERGESPHCLPLELAHCEDISIANLFLYRVGADIPFETGIRVSDSRRLEFRGVHAYSPGKLTFDNTLVDRTHGAEVRAREIASLRVSGEKPLPAAAPSGPELAPGAKVEKLAGGFSHIDGAVADAAGNVCFADARWNTIYRWNHARGTLETLTTAALQPAALAVARNGQLLVVSRHGNVYVLPPDGAEAPVATLQPQKNVGAAAGTPWLPVNRWRDSHDWLAANTRREPLRYVAPDGSLFLPAPESYPLVGRPGMAWRLGTIDLARCYALAPAMPGRPFYVADEFGQTTWRFTVQPDGTLTEPRRFAEEGEAGVAVDADGHVYVCAGQIFVYDATGKQIDVIAVPERPSALAFGGADGRTLFITARSSLYAVRTKAAGR